MCPEPDVTIGMPVRNGGQEIRGALDSLLGQSKGDFRLIISDNQSTDDTVAICADYAARDRRVTLVQQPENRGICGNFRYVLMAATTPFFMWACHDDLWAPDFIAANHAQLMANPQAIACGSRVTMIGPHGSRPSGGTEPLRGTPTERLAEFFRSPGEASRFYSLYRTAPLQRSFPEGIDVFGYDWIVLALTLLEGEYLELPEVLLKRGDHPADHYHRSLVRGQRRWLYRTFPHLPMALTLRRVLPPEQWRAVRPLVMRRNMIEALMYARYRFPRLAPALRRLAALEKKRNAWPLPPTHGAGA
ncbi:glycosyltransferase family 2 protein [Roseomonas sp. USHLN139]|uniref:glycosyltransferase family 2 protein n=1 Tax=Roseomonas sp. USHLN139 TaxID=3081298 RepID=UPI003B024498